MYQLMCTRTNVMIFVFGLCIWWWDFVLCYGEILHGLAKQILQETSAIKTTLDLFRI